MDVKHLTKNIGCGTFEMLNICFGVEANQECKQFTVTSNASKNKNKMK